MLTPGKRAPRGRTRVHLRVSLTIDDAAYVENGKLRLEAVAADVRRALTTEMTQAPFTKREAVAVKVMDETTGAA